MCHWGSWHRLLVGTSPTYGRWRVEELFEECKGTLGMGHYEAHAWTSWRHHMALVSVAHLFLTLTRQRLKKRRRR